MTEPLRVVVDNSAGLTAPPPACPRRARTLFIDFVATDSSYELRIQGSAMPEDGSERWLGRVQVPRAAVDDWVAYLHEQWDGSVIRRRRDGGYPYAEHVNLLARTATADREAVWRSLARAGHDLFKLLFHGQDDELKWIGDRLADALRADHQVICVHSDEVVVPWAMLYVPPDPADDLSGDAPVDRSGFWGLRHVIEHCFNGPARSAPHTRYAVRPLAGSFVDPELATRRGHNVAEPALRMLRAHTDLRQNASSRELEDELRGPARRYHVMYFSCHCVPDGNGSAKLRLPGAAVSTTNFDIWLRGSGLTANPLVFITACRSAGLEASPHHFSRTLLNQGANCLVGPYVNIPTAFARSFAARLLGQVLGHRATVGEAVHAVAVHFAERFDNPLGLTFSVYHGTDSHLCPEGPDVTG
ncbi:CHAT domain-containing protein [Pseudosporangium ferrugineum]|uniref:CHAT domain-containing protein n=1 Tax=Pseudosporangium ferrugineum TaxID=439699 RepID=A0A2T0RX09_9ACTN|nr:CHAT domain-containing protein [Pseudosporangium ferrugineum]PRY25714.1 CHAT domain-containing protein [Pseudosporangium ferrugineum]